VDHNLKYNHLSRSEKYVNISRIITLSFLTFLWTIRWVLNPEYSVSGLFLIHLGSLALGWLYSLFVSGLLIKNKLPGFLPWVTGICDLFLVTLGLISQTFSPQLIFPGNNITDNATYGLYFLIISFSVLRRNPKLSLFLSTLGAAAYGFCAFYLGRTEIPPAYFTANEVAKILFLLMSGAVSAVTARFISRAIEDSLVNEAKALESDQKIAHISQNLPGVLLQLQKTPGGCFSVTFISPGVRELMGVDEEIVLKHPELFSKWLDSEESHERLNHLINSTAQEISWTQEVSFTRVEKLIKWIRVGISAVKDKLGIITLNVVLLDITDRKQMELQLQEAHRAAEQASRAKSDFLATMSHELRTPLNGIMGLTEWLRSGEVLDSQVKPLETILLSTENLRGVIDDILDFSRLEAGRLHLHTQLFSLPSLTEEVIHFLQPQAVAKGLELRLALSQDLPSEIISDPKRVRQVLLNLLENALKYTLSGSVELTCDHIKVKTGVIVNFHVKDTGLGIPERERETIFEMFTQVEMGKTRMFGGVGLGLAICKSLATLLNGSIQVESQVGKGSQFTFSFPAEIPTKLGIKKDGEVAKLANSPWDSKKIKGNKILLVEDNIINQDVQKRLLERLGMEVLLASGGLEALDLLHKTPVDLVFLDWQMPVIDGLETARRIREEIPGGTDLKLIALSGHAFPGDKSTLLGGGFDGYLSKPVRLQDFKAVLSQHLGKS